MKKYEQKLKHKRMKNKNQHRTDLQNIVIELTSKDFFSKSLIFILFFKLSSTTYGRFFLPKKTKP